MADSRPRIFFRLLGHSQCVAPAFLILWRRITDKAEPLRSRSDSNIPSYPSLYQSVSHREYFDIASNMAVLRVLTAASFISTALAASTRSVISDVLPQPTCNGVTFATLGTNYCCPGIFEAMDSSNGAFCCVGATNLPAPRFSDCYPHCTSTTSAPALTPASQSCLTTIMVTDSAYSSKVNALGATQTSSNSFGATSPLSGQSSPVVTGNTSSSESSSGSSSGSSGSSKASTTALSGTKTSSGSSSQGSSASGGSSSSSTSASQALAARITSGPMAGAFMVAGGLAAIAAL
ncbi:hypothetical protein K461DRAFT_108340 [Myriangium duriaei CBS 260.36]|uniref:Uncharacterized protein n=1 Tax=Myriangium duriaei CBS 260.36 TaxID=1168546 RepID=A0A9P4J8L6_9PEZI|nr:hypothetical protein K461DRAFT_108340 [Myriangium duriaei CBS 260.36]